MTFIKRSNVEFIGVIPDKDLSLNDEDTKLAMEKAAKAVAEENKDQKEKNAN